MTVDQDFKRKLDSIAKQWAAGEVEDEWLFDDFRTSDVGKLNPEQALANMRLIFSILDRYDDESTVTELVETLICLARQSATTEPVEELLRSKSLLEQQFSEYGEYAKHKLSELFRYYRL